MRKRSYNKFEGTSIYMSHQLSKMEVFIDDCIVQGVNLFSADNTEEDLEEVEAMINVKEDGVSIKRCAIMDISTYAKLDTFKQSQLNFYLDIVEDKLS